MAINLFSDYGGFYNNYKMNDIPKVDVASVKAQDEEKRALEASVEIPKVSEITSPALENDNRSRTADLDNISLTFNAGEDYSYIGSEAEIGSLDMEQAISDMKKDKVLQDYNFFVGTTSKMDSAPEDANADGKFFVKF